jgi:hypothetical protein
MKVNHNSYSPLSRHRRIHESKEGSVEQYNQYEEEDLEGEEDQLPSLEEASPGSDHNYNQSSMSNMASMPAPSMGMHSMAAPDQLISNPQMISQHM